MKNPCTLEESEQYPHLCSITNAQFTLWLSPAASPTQLQTWHSVVGLYYMFHIFFTSTSLTPVINPFPQLYTFGHSVEYDPL